MKAYDLRATDKCISDLLMGSAHYIRKRKKKKGTIYMDGVRFSKERISFLVGDNEVEELTIPNFNDIINGGTLTITGLDIRAGFTID